MSKNIILTICISWVIVHSSCTDVEEVNLENNFVVEAFLFAGEPVDNIRLKTTFPISSTEDISEAINDAAVQLVKDNVSYDLISSGDDGYYHYPDTELTIASGDHFRLEINNNKRLATAQTIVPSPPTGAEISRDTVLIPRVGLTPAGIQMLRDALQGLVLNVSWSNTNRDWYYIVVENIETEKDPIFPMQIEEALEFFRFVSDPTQNDSQIIIGAGLRNYGTHEVRVYHVNQEYADLFENSDQDSRDLNEPPSNIENALGIFTAFASEKVFFEVVEE